MSRELTRKLIEDELIGHLKLTSASLGRSAATADRAGDRDVADRLRFLQGAVDERLGERIQAVARAHVREMASRNATR